jgi:2-keto-3-deoxy-L-arabinonate dehydratase
VDWLDFFGKVMDSTSLPVAIQNALDYLGVGLSVKGLMTLLERHPNFTLLKGEGPLVTMAKSSRSRKGGFRFSMGGADWN